MNKQLEFRLSGSGGQGLILAGIILADCAIKEGKNAIQTQSYGPEARGGASKAEVIISCKEIDFPKVRVPDVFLAMTQVAFDKYSDKIDENSVIIVDDTIELDKDKIKCKEIISLPIIKSAHEEIGKGIVANIIALGVLQSATEVVTREMLEKSILDRVPKGTEDLNSKALHLGFNLLKR
ncbi:MAG: 2-oxoacid:acceptor oxidoreductase family protein [Firmicutes bacterium]|jgi:2-oxoglutarate ferredoxin oxidoreductase subunit gamma|nr:2-oxoacid:acceptor oxidoreductase family protein [Bacillota bacterium]